MKSLPKIFFATILISWGATANGQGMAVNTTGAAANASSILDVTSTTQGVLVPRMTAAQRTAISSPATGLLVYQTDGTAGFYFYNGSVWTTLNSSGGTAGGDLTGSYPNPTISSSASTGNNIVTAINASGGGLSGAEIATNSVPVNAMSATGVRTSTTYLRGDNTWATVSGGSGTVTSVSSNNLSPLFTTSVSNATTTPTINYSLSNVGAHTVLSNSTSISGVPSFAPVSPLCLANNGGTASSSTYYRGDGQWATPSSGSTNAVEFYGTISSTLSLTANTLAQVAWDNATVNLSSQMNTTTGAFTASATGYYMVTMGGTINTSNSLFSLLKINGTIAAYGMSIVQTAVFGTTGQNALSHIVPLTAGDVLTTWMVANSGTTLQSGLPITYLAIYRIQ